MNRSLLNSPEAPADSGQSLRDRVAADLAAASSSPDRFDAVIEWLLLLLLGFMPIALGAVEAWSQSIVLIAVGVIGLCLLGKLAMRPGAVWVSSWVYLPVVLYLLLVGAQLIPLPASVVQHISPETAGIKERLLSDLPNAPEVLRTMTLSFYPPATREVLRVVLGAAVVFVAVIHVYRRPEQIKRLLAAIALIGGSMAVLALAQDVTHATAVYWDASLRPMPSYRATAGPFLNYNNFSQFMNLSIGAAVALLLMLVSEAAASKRERSAAMRYGIDQQQMVGAAAWAAVILLGAASIFLSGSRGGMLSFLVAFAGTTLVVAARRRSGSLVWILVVLGLSIFVCVVYFGFDLATSRLGSLSNLQTAAPVRWQSNKEVWAMWPHFRWVGIGLGAHEVTYPMFSHFIYTKLLEQLENDYLQTLEETGVVGAAAVLLFLGLIAACYVRAVRRAHRNRPLNAIVYGLGFGLMAVLVNSATDFGQRLFANACLTAIFCGLLVIFGRRREPIPPGELPPTPFRSNRQRTAVWVALVPALVIWGWILGGSLRATWAHLSWMESVPIAQDLVNRDWQGTNDQYARLITQVADASNADPADVKLRYWLGMYRWFSISRVYDQNHTHILLTDRSLDYTRRIAADLNQARGVCPTFGPVYCAVGQLELFVLNNPIGATHIRTGYALAPSHPLTCFIAGRLDAKEGRWDASLEEFRRSVQLAHPVEEAIEVYVREVDRPDLALKLVYDNRAKLSELAGILEGTKRYPDLAEEARTRAQSLAILEAAQWDASPDALAVAAQRLCEQHDYPGAIEYYRRALTANYANAAAHYGLAVAFAQSGKTEQALLEARVCLRQNPGSAAAVKMIEDLTMPPTSRPAP